MKKGYWKVCLKSGEIIEDKRITLLETNNNDYKLCQYIDDKKDVLCVLGKDSLDYAKWVEEKE